MAQENIAMEQLSIFDICPKAAAESKARGLVPVLLIGDLDGHTRRSVMNGRAIKSVLRLSADLKILLVEQQYKNKHVDECLVCVQNEADAMQVFRKQAAVMKQIKRMLPRQDWEFWICGVDADGVLSELGDMPIANLTRISVKECKSLEKILVRHTTTLASHGGTLVVAPTNSASAKVYMQLGEKTFRRPIEYVRLKKGVWDVVRYYCQSYGVELLDDWGGKDGENIKKYLWQSQNSHTSAKQGAMPSVSTEAETAAAQPTYTSDQGREQCQNAQVDERMDFGAPKGSGEREQTACEAVMQRS